MKQIKKSLLPIGTIQLMRLLSQLPAPLFLASGLNLANRYTMIYSNVPGPRESMSIKGVKTQELGALIPGAGNLCVGIGVLTHCDSLRITFQADKAYCQDAKEVIQLIEKYTDKVVDYRPN